MMKRFLASLLLLWPFALAACSIFEPEAARQRLELEQHRRAWAALQISHYRYTAQMSCFCPPENLHPVVLEVRNDTIVSAHHAVTGAAIPASPFDGYAQYYTVEQLFRVIEHSLRPGSRLEVAYDPVLHYPHYINTYIPNALDSGFSHTARELVSLP